MWSPQWSNKTNHSNNLLFERHQCYTDREINNWPGWEGDKQRKQFYDHISHLLRLFAEWGYYQLFGISLNKIRNKANESCS